MTALVIFLNAKWFITSGDDSYTHLDTYVSAGDSKKKISGTALKHLDEVPGADTDEFYRSTNLVTTGNLRSSSLLYGYNDVSTFSSTLNGGIVNYNNAMGNCRWNIVSIYDYNFRTYLNTLASVKYMGVAKKNTASIRSIAGNTTLFTTVLICAEASCHVPSIAPATSPFPDAYTVVPNIIVSASTITAIIIHFFFFI